jgi:uncharacterized protein (DUF934 family)
MRQIIRRRELATDDVYYAGEEATPGARAVQPFAEFLSDAAAAKPLADAVLAGPTDEVGQLAPHLSHLTLIVIDFPKIGDGRGFSQARLLRQRYGYRADLRARGVLKRDQIFFLARCGFNSFQLDANENLQAALAAFDTFSVAYQDGSDQLVRVQRRNSTIS